MDASTSERKPYLKACPHTGNQLTCTDPIFGWKGKNTENHSPNSVIYPLESHQQKSLCQNNPTN